MILSIEMNEYKDSCYSSSFALSDQSLEKKYNTTVFRNYFGGKYLINWAIFVKPRHPMMLEVLNNIVDIFRNEHLKTTVLRADEQRYRSVICATGPGILTATARKVMLENAMDPTQTRDIEILDMRVVKEDFKEYGGRFKSRYHNYKIKKEKNHSNYYLEYMQANKIPLIQDG